MFGVLAATAAHHATLLGGFLVIVGIAGPYVIGAAVIIIRQRRSS